MYGLDHVIVEKKLSVTYVWWRWRQRVAEKIMWQSLQLDVTIFFGLQFAAELLLPQAPHDLSARSTKDKFIFSHNRGCFFLAAVQKSSLGGLVTESLTLFTFRVTKRPANFEILQNSAFQQSKGWVARSFVVRWCAGSADVLMSWCWWYADATESGSGSARCSCWYIDALMLRMHWCCWYTDAADALIHQCCWCAEAADAADVLLLLRHCYCWYADASDVLMCRFCWCCWCADELMLLIR